MGTYKRSNTIAPINKLVSIKEVLGPKMPKVILDDPSEEEEEQVQVNRPLSPFSQIKQDVEQFRVSQNGKTYEP